MPDSFDPLATAGQRFRLQPLPIRPGLQLSDGKPEVAGGNANLNPPGSLVTNFLFGAKAATPILAWARRATRLEAGLAAR